jgi:hypothetical protein
MDRADFIPLLPGLLKPMEVYLGEKTWFLGDKVHAETITDLLDYLDGNSTFCTDKNIIVFLLLCPSLYHNKKEQCNVVTKW